MRYLNEYRSDTAAVKAAGPKAAIEALESLEEHLQKVREEEMQKLGKWSGRVVRSINKIPTLIPPTHPPTAKRIERILKQAPQSFREEYLASKALATEQTQGI